MNDKAIEQAEEDQGYYTWVEEGPFLQLSTISYMGKSKSKDEESSIKHRLLYVNNIVKKISRFGEIEIAEDKDVIENNIRRLCNGETRYAKIKVYVTAGYKRPGIIFLEIPSYALLHTELYFMEEDEDGENGKYREEANALLKHMVDELNCFCGTLGMETDVHDIFKIEVLLESIGDKHMYGIENVIWKIE